jgi:uncharacterized integral membrane protein (TIGR00697 family)
MVAKNYTDSKLDFNLKWITRLSMAFLAIYLTADAVAYKMITIENLIFPGPPFIFPLSYTLGDIIAEIYGPKIAKRIIWMALILQTFFVVTVKLIIYLPSPSFFHKEADYIAVFGNLPHFILAGFLAVLTSSHINVYLLSKWKVLLKGKHFFWRSFAASSIGGFILVIITICIGFSGTINSSKIIPMILSVYLLEMLYSLVFAYPASLLTGYLKINLKKDFIHI